MYESLKHLYDFNETTSLCIYEAEDKLYVVKKLPLHMGEYYGRIMNIIHPNVARTVFVEYTEDCIYAVREYVSGEPLSRLLREGVTLSEERASAIALQVARGLTELHKRGLVHRDINPNNILITNDGNAVIIDFGIVRSFEEDKSADTAILGTPGFAAPEQFGFSQSDMRTDIYAVGVMLNVMLTSRLPNEKLAGGRYGGIVAKCIMVDPNARYGSCEELAESLESGYADISFAEKLVRGIPGVRSEKIHKVVLSVIGYVFAVFCVITDLFSLKPSLVNYAAAALYWTLFLPVPLICFGDLFGIRERMPFTRRTSPRTKRLIYGIIGAVSIFSGMLLLGWINRPV